MVLLGMITRGSGHASSVFRHEVDVTQIAWKRNEIAKTSFPSFRNAVSHGQISSASVLGMVCPVSFTRRTSSFSSCFSPPFAYSSPSTM